jgi:hypothetical protein
VPPPPLVNVAIAGPVKKNGIFGLYAFRYNGFDSLPPFAGKLPMPHHIIPDHTIES